jgi:hypothetical protein
MSNYTISIPWSSKDSLQNDNTAKIISGDDFDTEFTAVKTAVNSKADLNGSVDNNWSCNALTVTTISLGGTSLTSTATELNLLDGFTLIHGSSASSGGVSSTSLVTEELAQEYVDTEIAAKASKVSILTGTIETGYILPLPSNYSAAQCSWIVSAGHSISQHGNNNQDHDFKFIVDEDREVTATGIGIDVPGAYGIANYMVIGVK